MPDFDYLEGKFPSSHLRLIGSVKNGNRYEETDANQLMRPEDFDFIQDLLGRHGLNVTHDSKLLLDLVTVAHGIGIYLD